MEGRCTGALTARHRGKCPLLSAHLACALRSQPQRWSAFCWLRATSRDTRETLTSHLPLKVVPHPSDLLCVFLQRQEQEVTRGQKGASPLGWPCSSRCRVSAPRVASGGCRPLVPKLTGQAQNDTFHNSCPSAKVASEVPRKLTDNPGTDHTWSPPTPQCDWLTLLDFAITQYLDFL